MWFRSPPLLLVATTLCAVSVLPLAAQQVPNPVLPGPSGSGDGLTRDALEAPAAPPQPANEDTSHRTTARHTTPHRSTTTHGSAKGSAAYATIPRRRHRHRSKPRSSEQAVVSRGRTGPTRRTIRNRAPLVSFIYWWNGWVIRTFHTRSGTVLYDTIGAKS